MQCQTRQGRGQAVDYSGVCGLAASRQIGDLKVAVARLLFEQAHAFIVGFGQDDVADPVRGYVKQRSIEPLDRIAFDIDQPRDQPALLVVRATHEGAVAVIAGVADDHTRGLAQAVQLDQHPFGVFAFDVFDGQFRITLFIGGLGFQQTGIGKFQQQFAQFAGVGGIACLSWMTQPLSPLTKVTAGLFSATTMAMPLTSLT